jgi:hypothetical protein
MSYSFRKIYADLITEDGTVCVLYLTWVRFWKTWYPSAGVEIYGPDGTREIHRANSAPGPVAPDTPLTDLPLRIELEDGPFELEYVPVHAGWTPQDHQGDLDWSVKLARGHARASWDGRRPDLVGTGYVDFVELTRPTRWLGFETLTWGRFHLPGRTVVFDELQLASGDVWRPARVWPGDERTAAPSETRAELGEGQGIVQLGGERLELQAHRVLHRGDAFDPDRIPSPVDRAVCQMVGGPHHEVRWFGTATAADGTVGHGLWERVHFGRQARERLSA